jgi:hypothetical protein
MSVACREAIGRDELAPAAAAAAAAADTANRVGGELLGAGRNDFAVT